MDREKGVFAISVAADLVSMQAQNLRVYERRGLIEPDRTTGGSRLYSAADIDRLHRIRELLEDGLNLAGIGRVLALEADNERLQDELHRVRASGSDGDDRDRGSAPGGASGSALG